jgi:hypothetical protein
MWKFLQSPHKSPPNSNDWAANWRRSSEKPISSAIFHLLSGRVRFQLRIEASKVLTNAQIDRNVRKLRRADGAVWLSAAELIV